MTALGTIYPFTDLHKRSKTPENVLFFKGMAFTGFHLLSLATMKKVGIFVGVPTTPKRPYQHAAVRHCNTHRKTVRFSY